MIFYGFISFFEGFFNLFVMSSGFLVDAGLLASLDFFFSMSVKFLLPDKIMQFDLHRLSVFCLVISSQTVL